MTKRIKKCRNCGTEFKAHTSLQVACSWVCLAEIRKRKPRRRRSSTRVNRVKRFYGGKCAMHSLIRTHDYFHAIQGHHIIYLSQKGPDKDWNIIPLCRTCHYMVHPNKGFWQPRLFVIKNGIDWFNKISDVDQFYKLPELMQPRWLRIAEKLSVQAANLKTVEKT